MSVIAVVSGSYCRGEEVARRVSDLLGYRLIDDAALVAETSRRFQVEESKLLRAMVGKTSIFNKFTRERERSLACLKTVVADHLQEDQFLFHGFAGHLLPRDVSHVLKVCLIAEVKYRTQVAQETEGLTEKDAMKRIHRDDEALMLWVDYWFNRKDPWDASLYDIVVPMGKITVDEAVGLIDTNVRKDVLKVTAASRQAAEDFRLAAQVEMALVNEGHDVSVAAAEGGVLLTINKQVLKLAALEEELKRVASSVPGVRSVATKVGPGFYQHDIYRKFDFEMPSKVLLVDDEREFVQTLSDRLEMRDLGGAVVYDGEEALSMVEEEEPEVMVLDLKMPGIDGVEVLRRVKTEHPDVEVIVLTGHGSQEIERVCMDLGAFAYLEKPVDIEKLTETMKAAYQKSRHKRGH
jgi:CheY-like chemotaxis protein/cytidylate kinase